MRARCWMLVPALLAIPAAARSEDARLRARLADPVRVEVQALVDSAAAESLPSDALVQRALEGATKGAGGPQIVRAVRLLLVRLRESREILGPRSQPAELVASAHCLQAGADSAAVRRLRQARGDRSLIVPLVVLTDLIGRGAPAPLASQATLALAQAGVSDAAFLEMRQQIETDIISGAAPAAALARRSRAVAPSAFPATGERTPSPIPH